MYLHAFFSEEEFIETDNFKKSSGMTYRAILEKALDFYIENDLPYIKQQYIFYSTIGKERKKRRSINISEETNNKLSSFCKEHNYSKSSVAAQAILAYIKR